MAELSEAALEALAAKAAQMTLNDAAKATGLPPRTIRKALRSGDLRATITDHRWSISPADLNQWVEAGMPINKESK